MSTTTDNLTVIYDKNLISFNDGTNSLCHDNAGTALHFRFKLVAKHAIGLIVKSGERVIKDKDF